MDGLVSVLADLIKAGVDPDLVARVAAEIEAAALRGAALSAGDARSARQERNARYYVKKSSEKRLIKTNQDVSDEFKTVSDGEENSLPDKEKSPTPPKEINPSQTLTSFGKESANARFSELWSVYPKRAGSNPKQPAEKKFLHLVRAGTDPADIIAGARAYAASVSGADPQFTAMTITWLNQGRWKDDYRSPPPRAGPYPQSGG